MLNVAQTERLMKAMQSMRMASADAAGAYGEGQEIDTPEMMVLHTIARTINDCLVECEQLQLDLVPAEL